MRECKAKKSVEGAFNNELTALARVAAASFEIAENDLAAKIASLTLEVKRYKTAFEKISQGICFYDAGNRLILSNARYAEMYGLRAEDIRIGATLREITELRYAAKLCTDMTIDDYISWCVNSNQRNIAETKTLKLKDGRTIVVFHQPLRDGSYVATHDDVTERLNKNISLQALLDWVPDYLWVKDTSSRFIIANKSLALDSGRATPADMTGLSDFDIHPEERALEFFTSERHILTSGQPMIDREELVEIPGGVRKWLLSTKVPVRDGNGEIFGLVGIARNITDRKLADDLRTGQAHVLEMLAIGASLKEVLDYLIRLAESQLTGIAGSIQLMDKDGAHLRRGAAPSLPATLNRDMDGIRVRPNAGSYAAAAFHAAPVITADIMSDPLWDGCRELAAPFGYRSCWSTPILSHQGCVLGVFTLYSANARAPSAIETRLIDTTVHIAGLAIERKLNADRIQFMASHDTLTGLANRAQLKDCLAKALSAANEPGRAVSVVYIDLDSFKAVNDSLGHNAGDELLKTVAARMVNSVRSTDIVVRIGGDEFVIILVDHVNSASVHAATLQRIRSAIAEPMYLAGYSLRVTCSMGFAGYPDDGRDAETLLANADAAMYRAKETGRDNFQFYTPKLSRSVRAKFALQEDLRGALERAELALNYLPQVNLQTGRIAAVGALIRWNHPRLGVIPPATFIPIAEATGQIVPISDWAIFAACKQNKDWQDAGLAHITIGVSVSARQFREKSWVDRVAEILRKTGLSAKYLELELTESLIVQDVGDAVEKLTRLRALGVQLAIDNFGTGYSGLGTFKNFPADRLKIDKSLIIDTAESDYGRALIRAVISLGHSLKMRVIAKGVETQAQLDILRSENCDEIQGYHFSQPVLHQEIEKILVAGGQSIVS
jgi:diguanylate cyclase (GGDEF)-like protein/PAS domain S-box-containing protein